jgi:hypothetical protein
MRSVKSCLRLWYTTADRCTNLPAVQLCNSLEHSIRSRTFTTAFGTYGTPHQGAYGLRLYTNTPARGCRVPYTAAAAELLLATSNLCNVFAQTFVQFSPRSQLGLTTTHQERVPFVLGPCHTYLRQAQPWAS